MFTAFKATSFRRQSASFSSASVWVKNVAASFSPSVLNTIELFKNILEEQNIKTQKALVEIFQRFSEFDVSDKRHLVNLIPPTDIDFKTGALSLNLNQAFLKILSKKSNRKTNKKNEFH